MVVRVRFIIWATFAVAWLMFNPFISLRSLAENKSPEKSAPEASQILVPPNAVPKAPRVLNIPRLGLVANFQTVGNDREGNVGIPDNYTDVGWYRESVLPGEGGAALVVGHVNDRYAAPAVFAQLHKLAPGNEIWVTDQDGVARQFLVEETASYPYDDFPRQKIFGPYNEPRLHLITCTGKWLKAERVYDQRLIVFARLADGKPTGERAEN
jgi:sortase (surface protein transpeptidase)